jgi:hypothetical protein
MPLRDGSRLRARSVDGSSFSPAAVADRSRPGRVQTQTSVSLCSLTVECSQVIWAVVFLTSTRPSASAPGLGESQALRGPFPRRDSVARLTSTSFAPRATQEDAAAASAGGLPTLASAGFPYSRPPRPGRAIRTPRRAGPSPSPEQLSATCSGRCSERVPQPSWCADGKKIIEARAADLTAAASTIRDAQGCCRTWAGGGASLAPRPVFSAS